MLLDSISLRRSSLLGLLVLAAASFPGTAHALDPFSNASSSLENPDVASGAPIAIVDMNADGLDDIVRLDEGFEFEIEYQQDDGSFVHTDFGNIGGSGAWGMAIADVDNNGYPDVFAGGAYDGLKLLLANADGTDYDGFTLDPPYELFVQCVSFADIDNNGAIDLFVCHDDGMSVPFAGDGMGGFDYDFELIRPETTLPSDDSGNYGVTWTDYDLDGDLDLYISKCRLFSSNPDDPRRLNLLFENDGDNNFVDVAADRGLQPPAQSWSSDFADIDNDDDFDMFLTTHVLGAPVDHQSSTLYENDGTNNYIDITDAAGMADDIDDIDTGIQTHFEDFDNDGFVDLLVTGNAGEHRLFMNNGDKTFTAAANPFPTDGRGIQSAAIGDLNNDGFPDIIAGFATGYNQPTPGAPDRLFLNPGNDNNWVNVRLTGVESNRSGVGAMVEVHGSWGVQRREVRAGEAYGIVNGFTRHFGIGTEETIDNIVIRWPSGQVDEIPNAPINQVIHVTEGCPETFYADADGDGYGDPEAGMMACIATEGHVADDTDCDDNEPTNFPGNVEVCDQLDNDCDEEVDEDLEDCVAGSSTGDSDTDGDTSATGTTMAVTAGSVTAGTVSDTDGGSDDTGDDGGATDDGGGCGCRTDGRDGAAWLLPLLLIPAFRRRRRG